MTGLLWQPNESTSTTPTNLNQVYNLCLYTDPKPSPTAWPFQAAWLITSEFLFFFKKEKKKNDEGPIETHIYSSKTDLLLSIRYSYCLRNGAYGRPANSLQTSVMHFSAQPQLPHKPIVLERRAWPPLSLALPFSSSFFDSEEQSGRRCSRRAVEGESAISPSLPCS